MDTPHVGWFAEEPKKFCVEGVCRFPEWMRVIRQPAIGQTFNAQRSSLQDSFSSL
jgi:hypothetical protein